MYVGELWSGAALFERVLLEQFTTTFGSPPPQMPLGDLFDRSRLEYPLRRLAVPRFINVNTIADLAAAHVLTINEVHQMSPRDRDLAWELACWISAQNSR
jgi:hypothetical protein